MRTLHLSLITSNQKSKEKAFGVSKAVCELLPNVSDNSISKYVKFENSYKLTFDFQLEEVNLTEEMIKLSDKICSPWTVYYDRSEKEVELLFNQSKNTTFRKVEFNTIRWGQLK